MRAKPNYRHGVRSGKRDGASLHRQNALMVKTLAEAERVGSIALESLAKGWHTIAAAQFQRAAQVYLAVVGRE